MTLGKTKQTENPESSAFWKAQVGLLISFISGAGRAPGHTANHNFMSLFYCLPKGEKVPASPRWSPQSREAGSEHQSPPPDTGI